MDVRWSPNHDDKFYTFGTNLSLYRVSDITVDKASSKEDGMRISEKAYASLMSILTDVQYKCVAWRPDHTPDHLLAIGSGNGRVLMSSFGKGGLDDPNHFLGKELIPRHHRTCNILEWNPVDSCLLAEVLEKTRTDPCILVWDIRLAESITERKLSSSMMEPPSFTKPVAEIGASETCSSLAWFAGNHKQFICGMNHKLIRIYDLRDSSRPQSSVMTKSVHCVNVDRKFENRIASCSENQIMIWDTRFFDKPVLTLFDSHQLLKLSWCPTRSGLLACSYSERPVLKLYDFQLPSVGDDMEPAYIERSIQPSGASCISSFDWHPTQKHRLLTVTPSGAVHDVHISDRIPVSWSSDIYLTWAFDSTITHCHSVKLSKETSNDIAVKIRRRAMKGYGLNITVSENLACVAGEERLRKLWSWIAMIKPEQIFPDEKDSSRPLEQSKIFENIFSKTMSRQQPENIPEPKPPNPLSGVMSIFHPQPTRSDLIEWTWYGLEKRQLTNKWQIYFSRERSKAIEVCGWKFDRDSPSLPIIDRLESEHQFERAAAIAIFNLRMTRAADLLKKGAIARDKNMQSGVNLNVVAMALAGFTDDKNTMWKEMCSDLLSTITHPYLKAIFYFLTTSSDSYESIFTDSNLDLADQVAFACIYLSDRKLMEYLKKQTTDYVNSGDPVGILLTGLSNDGVELFGNYVDRTSDIQTAVVALMQAFSDPDLLNNLQVRSWIEIYRDLLDSMRLWKERAEFDIFLRKFEKAAEADKQINIICTFCAKPIVFDSKSNRNRTTTSTGPPIKPRIQSCPYCRKPLPRCSICMLHMGTASGTVAPKLKAGVAKNPEKKLSKISDWFTWCQTCLHGGHADHLAAWFKIRKHCPVSDCNCKCGSLDPIADIASDKGSRLSISEPPNVEE